MATQADILTRFGQLVRDLRTAKGWSQVGFAHEVGLDRVDAELEREIVRRARMLGSVARGAAVPDHERGATSHRLRLPARGDAASAHSPLPALRPPGARLVGYR